jgi:hypothetical protein
MVVERGVENCPFSKENLLKETEEKEEEDHLLNKNRLEEIGTQVESRIQTRLRWRRRRGKHVGTRSL